MSNSIITSFPRQDFRRDECPAIPSNSGRQGTTAAAGLVGLCVWPFNAPTVRQIHAPPSGIIEAGLVRVRHVALDELPAKIVSETLTMLVFHM